MSAARTARSPRDLRRPNGEYTGPREHDVPERAAARLIRLQAVAINAQHVFQEALNAAFEAMGCDLERRDDGLMWNLVDGSKPGTLKARFGPPQPDKDAVMASVEAALAQGVSAPEPPGGDTKPN